MTEEKRNYWQRRTSRRRTLQGSAIGAAGLTAAALIGCSQDSGQTSTTTTGGTTAVQAKRGGTLVFPSASSGIFAAGLDPHVVGNSESGHHSAFYQGLVRQNPESFQVEPELAQRWEQPSQTEYIFHLAPNVKWHNKPPVNGRTFTAEDVVFNINRLGTNEPRFVNKALVENIARAEAVNQSTVRVITKTPDVATLANFADWSALMLAREAVERANRFATPEEVVGTGAFILRSMDDVSAVLERNPEYWKPGLPYLDGVRYVHSGDPQAGWAAFLSGQIDVQAVPGQETVKFAAEAGDRYTYGWFKDVAAHNLWLNTRVKPTDDIRVRRALRLMVDHRDFLVSRVETWWGPGAPNILNSAFPHSCEEWEFTQQEFDNILEWKPQKDEAVREALALLSAAGYTRDNPLKFEIRNNTTPNQGRITAQVLQGQYNKFSQGAVQTELNLTDNTTLSQNLSRGEFTVAAPTARGSYFDPEQVLRNIYDSTGGRNFGKWSDPRADELIDRQRGIFDTAQRKVVVKDILRYFVDNAPYVTACTRDQMSAFQRKVKGLAPVFFTGVYAFQFEQAWLDV